VNGFDDILRPILLAVSAQVLDDIAFYESELVLEDELGGLDRHVVVITTLLSI
jgi:hypothetical protein